MEVLPLDEHNRSLVDHAHPSDWTNPTPQGRYNLVAIGGGTAGIISALGAAGLGGRAALVERHLLGGDCLNYGCVPSKALIRAARAAHEVANAGEFGVEVDGDPRVNFGQVMERLRRLRAQISHHDSAERFSNLGADVYLGDATFTGPDTLEVAGQTLRFSRAVIATGARAFVPRIEGLADVGFLTNETVFSLTELPRRLVVIGAGPIYIKPPTNVVWHNPEEVILVPIETDVPNVTIVWVYPTIKADEDESDAEIEDNEPEEDSPEEDESARESRGISTVT